MYFMYLFWCLLAKLSNTKKLSSIMLKIFMHLSLWEWVILNEHFRIRGAERHSWMIFKFKELRFRVQQPSSDRHVISFLKLTCTNIRLQLLTATKQKQMSILSIQDYIYKQKYQNKLNMVIIKEYKATLMRIDRKQTKKTTRPQWVLNTYFKNIFKMGLEEWLHSYWVLAALPGYQGSLPRTYIDGSKLL